MSRCRHPPRVAQSRVQRPAGTKVLVCTRATDMRCGFDTLAAQVVRFLGEDPLSGHFEWLAAQQAPVLPKSPMGLAGGDALGNRAALTRYTEAGFLQIDNNASERALRVVAIGRKNYLFAGSDSGARSAAVLYSVVGTCGRLGLDPFAFLRDTFARLPVTPVGQIDDLLPDRWVETA